LESILSPAQHKRPQKLQLKEGAGYNAVMSRREENPYSSPQEKTERAALPANRKSIGFTVLVVIAWQVLVWLLVSAGIMGAFYHAFGIPWSATGWLNVVGTTLGLLILEFPMFVVIPVLCWTKLRRHFYLD
jgi:hypothetical protein